MDNQLIDKTAGKNKFIKLAIGLFLIAVFFIGLILFWANKDKKADNVILGLSYTVPGVPYHGIWNHQGEAAYFSGETAAAVFSVLNYWTPEIAKPIEVDKFFKAERKTGDSVGKESIIKYVGLVAKDQYVIKSVVLKQEEIKQYINSEAKTPLLVYLPVSDEEPIELSYNPVVVIIGINENEKKIIVHDFWLGNNREISFAELNKLWEKIKPKLRNKYLVIQPKNLKEALEKIDAKKVESYPARLPLMIKNEAMIKNFVIGVAAQDALNYNLANSFLSKVESDPGFQVDLIPVIQVQVLARLSAIRLQNKDLSAALSYVNRAIELNHDIDKPLNNGWPGYEYGRTDKVNEGKSTDPDRVLGNIYKALGEKEKAIEAYKKVLNIDPTLQPVAEALGNLQK